MTIIYGACFQAAASAYEATVDGGVATMAAGNYCPGSGSTPVASGTTYSALAAYLTTLWTAAAGEAVTVTWSATTGLYRIQKSVAMNVTFTGAAGTKMRELLGLSGNQTGITDKYSDAIPAQFVMGTIGARSNVAGLHEDDDVAEEAVADDGTAYVMTKKTTALQDSWVQQMETKALVYDGDSSNYYAYKDFFQNLRGDHPFVVWQDAVSTSWRLTAKGAAFRPTRVTPDFDDLWIVPFAARYLGTV